MVSLEKMSICSMRLGRLVLNLVIAVATLLTVGLLLLCGHLISRYRTDCATSSALEIPPQSSVALQHTKVLSADNHAFLAKVHSYSESTDGKSIHQEHKEKFDEVVKCYEQPCKLPTNEVNFLVVGDWGGQDEAPFTSKLQRAVAKQIVRFTKAVVKPAFMVNVGDNFYQNGVKSVDDPRFNSTFESVYSNDVPWYTIAGNHDWYGNVKAQIDYTSRSKKWIYPNYFYSFAYQLADGTIAKFIMVDTQVMCGKTIWNKNPKLRVKIPKGPDLENQKLAKEQEKWLERELRESANIHHLFVVGHYQVYSIGRKKQMPCMKRKLGIRTLAKNRISAYLSGHEHMLQHIVMRSPTKRTKVHYVLSGEAGKTDEPEHYADGIPSEGRVYQHGGLHSNRTSGGFISVHLTAIRAEFTFIDADGVDWHRFVIPSRLRNRKDEGVGWRSKMAREPARIPRKQSWPSLEIGTVSPKN